jgi:hypothetical protein
MSNYQPTRPWTEKELRDAWDNMRLDSRHDHGSYENYKIAQQKYPKPISHDCEQNYNKLVTFLNTCLATDKFSRCVGLNIMARDLKAEIEKESPIGFDLSGDHPRRIL